MLMFASETAATRALGRFFELYPTAFLKWLRGLGIAVTEIESAAIELRILDGRRRVDLFAYIKTEGGSSQTVIVEAKIEALLDLDQLRDAQKEADVVVALVPAGLRSQATPDGILLGYWEDLLATMSSSTDPVARFLADELGHLLTSEKLEHRRRLAALVPSNLSPDWTAEVTASTAGGDLLTISGPEVAGRQVWIEITNTYRGTTIPFQAHVLATTDRSEDPVVWQALKAVEATAVVRLPASVRTKGVGRRTPAERALAAATGVAGSWRRGFGERMLDAYGWAGFGPVLVEDNEDLPLLIESAVDVALAVDQQLRRLAS